MRPSHLHGVSIEEEELVNSIKGMISKDTWEETGDIKRKKKPQKPPPKGVSSDQKIIKTKQNRQQINNIRHTLVQIDTSKNVIN